MKLYSPSELSRQLQVAEGWHDPTTRPAIPEAVQRLRTNDAIVTDTVDRYRATLAERISRMH